MDRLTPDEFFARVGFRVPDGVIRNLEAEATELPKCAEGCHLDRPTAVVWHSPGCPNLEDLGLFDKLKP